MTDPIERRLRVERDAVTSGLRRVAIPPFRVTRNHGPGVGSAGMALIAVVAVGWLAVGGTPSSTNDVDTVAVLPAEEVALAVTTSPARPIPPEQTEQTSKTVLVDAGPGEFVVPLNEAWNADGSMILVYATGGPGGASHRVYNSQNGQLVNRFQLEASDIEQVYWDPADAMSLLYLTQNRLMRLNVVDQQVSTMAEFPECLAVSATSGGSALSWDGQLMTFSCERSTGSHLAAAYHLDTAEFVRSAIDVGFDPPLPLPSGTGVVVMDESGTIRQYDPWFEPLDRLPIAPVDPGFQLSQDGVGRDVALAPSFDGPTPAVLVSYDLASASSKVVVGVGDGANSPPTGINVSGAARSEPGRAVLAVESGAVSDVSGALIVVDTGDGHVVASIDHLNAGEGDSYWGSTFVSLSPDGTRVLYSTDRSGPSQALSVWTVSQE